MLTETQIEALEQLLYTQAMNGDTRIGLQLLKVNTRVPDSDGQPTTGGVELPDVLEPPELEDE